MIGQLDHLVLTTADEAACDRTRRGHTVKLTPVKAD